jgi:hypothetical protein
MKKNKPENPLASFMRIRPQSSYQKVEEHEGDAANSVGGERHIGSGRLQGLKSDASSEEYQVECKQTSKQSLSVTLEWLEKISTEAMGRGKVPIMHFRFLNAPPAVSKDWVLVPEWQWKRILSDAKKD